VWAVGSSIKGPNDGVSVSKNLVEHWNGTSWTVVPSPGVGAGNNVLTAVAARSATEAWAVGYYGDVTGSIPVRRAPGQRPNGTRWTGTRWSVVRSRTAGSGDTWLTAVVAPAGTTDVLASGSSAAGTLAMRFTS